MAVNFTNKYPYTDFHELNLDWVIKEVKYWSEKVGKTIQSIELTGSAGLVDTYTINYSDGTTSTFDVTNGNGIASVAKTGTAGLVDTYTITFQDGSTSTFDVHNGTASIDPTLTLADYAADAKVTGDELFSRGDAITFPTDYSGDVLVTAISGKILTGGHNLISQIGFIDGTYSLNGITAVISGNTITFNGTSSGAVYLAPHLGTILNNNSGLAAETSYDLPAIQYRVGGVFTGIPSSVTFAVRSRISGNINVTTPACPYFDGTYDHSTWGEMYVYIPSGVSFSNATIVIGIVPMSVSTPESYFTEYNNIVEISSVAAGELAVYSILDGTATVYKRISAIGELQSEVADLSDKVFIKYISGSGPDSSTEKVEIYVKSIIGFIRYDFLHTVDVVKNADIWRVGYAYAVNDDFSVRFALTTAGEWECALKLSGRPDFSGGYAHGDEKIDSIEFFVDGVPVNITDYIAATKISSFKIIQTSTLYDPNDGTTVIAYHGSEHNFSGKKFEITQSINWVISETITQCYLAMFPAAKTVTDRLYTDKNFIISTADGTPQIITGAKDTTVYKESVGFNARFAIGEYPTGIDTSGDCFLTTDNGGNPYNKCYYVISRSGTASVSVDDLWKSQTIYELKISK